MTHAVVCDIKWYIFCNNTVSPTLQLFIYTPEMGCDDYLCTCYVLNLFSVFASTLCRIKNVIVPEPWTGFTHCNGPDFKIPYFDGVYMK